MVTLVLVLATARGGRHRRRSLQARLVGELRGVEDVGGDALVVEPEHGFVARQDVAPAFALLELLEPSAQLEVRASWTPLDHAQMGAHVEAWSELLCTAAGLPPVPDGVAAMPSRRGQRGR